MFDATKLLGELMANRSAPSAENRLNSVVSQTSTTPGPMGSLGSLLGGLGGSGGGSGGLGGLLGGLGGAGGASGGLGGLLGGLGGSGGGGLGGLLGQLAGGLQQAASSARTEVSSNNPAAVGGLGALAGAVLGGGRGALGGGLMAVLGSLAVSALQNASANSASQAAPAAADYGSVSSPPAAVPATTEEMQANARLLLQAMISAAKADGQVDAAEIGKITGKLHDACADPEAQQFVMQEMSKPLDLPGLAAQVQTPEMAVQVYAASLLAIEVDSQAEQDYLAELAQTLQLAPETVNQVHQAMGLPT